MYKKIAEISALSVLVAVAGGLWGVEQYLDYAPGMSPSPLIDRTNGLASSALDQSSEEESPIRGEDYYLKNSEEIDADLAAMQAKMLQIWKDKYPYAASSCDLVRIQESFDGNDKIDRTICKPNRVAGVVANRFLKSLFDYPDDREIMEEVIALKWALLSEDYASDPSAQAFKTELLQYQRFLDDFTDEQYDNLRASEKASNMNNSLTRGKFLGLEIAFLFAEQEKLVVDYILGE